MKTKGKQIIIVGDFILIKRHIRKEAILLGISGILTKIDNQTLNIVVTGIQNNLERFVEKCKMGNPESTIQNITISNKQFLHPFLGFEIIGHHSQKHRYSKFQKILGQLKDWGIM